MKRGKKIFIALLIFALIALSVVIFWWIFLKGKVWTDDAYVHGNRVIINAPVEGIITAYFADDNDRVEKGQLLVTLDTTQYQLLFDQEMAQLAKVAQDLKSLEETTIAQRFQIKGQQAEIKKGEYDLKNRLALQPLLAVPGEEVEHAQITLEVAKNRLEDLQHLLKANLALLGKGPLQDNPRLVAQKERVKEAYVSLTRCHIYSPTTGYVAKRGAQLGEWVHHQFQLMSVVPEDQMWIEANFKETQLRYVRVGQPAKVTIDQYGDDAEFEATVQGIQMGSGGAFAILPAQNATGNWIKIVQRVPTRILLKKEDLKKWPLRIGLSASVTVDITEQSFPRMRPQEPPHVVESTDIYPVDFVDINKRMDEILSQIL